MSRIYEPAEKREMVSALQIALTRIWRGDSEEDYYSQECVSICKSLPEGRGGDLVRAEIQERLDGFFGIRSWLVAKGHAGPEIRFGHHRAIQKYRIQWIKALIEEFSE